MAQKKTYEKLFQPGRLGTVEVKNRVVKPAQSMHYAEEDGTLTDRNLDFYESIAQGGCGLIVVETSIVEYPRGYSSFRDLRIDDDRFIPGFSRLTELIHKHDTKTFLMLCHGGPTHAPIEGTKPTGPSNLAGAELPRPAVGQTVELTIPDIQTIIQCFVAAAERAKKAGFDGVEIHAAHAYLVGSFLSGAWNKRQDNYGGSLENRARLACEVVAAIKSKVGKAFPVGVRVSGAEYGFKDSSSPQEVQAMCQMIAKAGADYIHVSCFGYGPQYLACNFPEHIFYPETPEPLGEGLDGSRNGWGSLSLLAAGIKQAVSIPVVAVGRIDPALAEEILREGRADFTSLGRCQLADPQIVRKVKEGREEDIAPCTADLACIDAYGRGKAVVCRINAAIGREKELELKPAKKKKRVLVVGGGPSGLEAARVAALRGHEVELYERHKKLGGAMLIAGLVKGFEVEDITPLIDYYKGQMKKLGVKVNLGTEVDAALVKRVNPDVLILAVGGTPALPDIEGITLPIVASQGEFYSKVTTALDLFGPKRLRSLTKYYLPVGKRVVIIGGDIQGLQLAEFLIKLGRQVTVTEPSNELGAEMMMTPKFLLLPWLARKGCTVLSGVTYERVTEKGLVLKDKEGKQVTLEADMIIPAIHLASNTALFDAAKGFVPETHLIGDAKEAHLVRQAIAAGYETALKL